LIAQLRGLPDHRLLDRVVRGRAWIPILGVLLAGIVAMQVEVLKLNATMGRTIERGTALQSRNEQLRASVASLSDEVRIERLAARMGMVMPPPQAVDFLASNPNTDIYRALGNIHAPNATAFMAALPVIDTPAGAAAATSPAGALTTSSTPAAAQTSGATTSSLAPATGTTSAPTTTNTPSTTGTPATTGAPATTGTAATTGTPATTSAGAAPTTNAAATTGATGTTVGVTPTQQPSASGGTAPGVGG
jgi:hypothetical protein